MKTKLLRSFSRSGFMRGAVTFFVALILAAPAFAQAASPWENAVGVLQQAFTSTIARGLSLVAIVVSGLTFAFGEGGSKRVLAGVLFGVGMAIAAVGASLLNIAAHEGFPPALSTIGALLLVLPMVTTFKRLIFGES